MKKTNITKIILAIFALLASFGLVLPSTVVTADSICDNPNISEEIRAASGCQTNVTVRSPGAVVGNIVKIVVGILGLVAVVVIVYGGVQYMSSSGDPGKVKKAKDTILYAAIGLAVCALAFAITQFAINAINGASTPSQDTNQQSNSAN